MASLPSFPGEGTTVRMGIEIGPIGVVCGVFESCMGSIERMEMFTD